MNRLRSLDLWWRAVQCAVLAACVCFSLGATDAGSRATNLSHRMMCSCGCAQMLGECNHVGCPSSGPMLEELKGMIAGGSSDQQILDSFAAKYGATVLAAPTFRGFDLVGWIAPFAVFAAAALGTVLLVKRWSIKPEEAATAAAGADGKNVDPAFRDLRERIRRETEYDGGAGL
jgi:cytochrome c-type biogenesis protein CcmH/NrfF